MKRYLGKALQLIKILFLIFIIVVIVRQGMKVSVESTSVDGDRNFQALNIENGNYNSKLELPHIGDLLFKIKSSGRGMACSPNIKMGMEDTDVGYMYVYDRKKRFYDGAVVTKIMFLTVIRNKDVLMTNQDKPHIQKIENRMTFKVEYNKTIVYKEKANTFYIRDGSIKLRAPKITIGTVNTGDKAVLERYESHVSGGEDGDRPINHQRGYPETYNQQMELYGVAIREKTVDYGDFELYRDNQSASLAVKFTPDEKGFRSYVHFVFDDPKYGIFEGRFE